MKYLILVLVIAVVLWWARSRSRGVTRQRPAPPPPALQAMVPCAHCGVHLPRAEAVPGALGIYCSDEHRRARGDRPE